MLIAGAFTVVAAECSIIATVPRTGNFMYNLTNHFMYNFVGYFMQLEHEPLLLWLFWSGKAIYERYLKWQIGFL